MKHYWSHLWRPPGTCTACATRIFLEDLNLYYILILSLFNFYSKAYVYRDHLLVTSQLLISDEFLTPLLTKASSDHNCIYYTR